MKYFSSANIEYYFCKKFKLIKKANIKIILTIRKLEFKEHSTQISNVLVIGCGGAGLRASIEIKQAGLDVCILGKRPRTDAHTVLAAGGINAAFANLDKKDSWQQHFIDTYQEGYCIGNP